MTAKSRYLASIGQQPHHFENDEPTEGMTLDVVPKTLDDPPPPPPGAPNKRNGVKQRHAAGSVSTSRTSAMSSSRNSVSSSSDPAKGDRQQSPEHQQQELPSSISVESGTMSLNYDEILGGKSEDSSNFSLPILSVSSAESSKAQSQQGQKQQNFRHGGNSISSGNRSQNSKQKNRVSSTASRTSGNRHDLQSVVSSDSYSTLGFSQLESSVMSPPPPPPPPGAPPNASTSSNKNKPSSRNGRSSSSANRSAHGSTGHQSSTHKSSSSRKSKDSQGNGSVTKAEFHTEEFSNVDFDLGSLKSNHSRGVQSHQSPSHSHAQSHVQSHSPSHQSRSRTADRSIKSRQSRSPSNRSKSSHANSRRSRSRSSPRSRALNEEEVLKFDDIDDNESEESVKTEVLRYGEVNENESAPEGNSINSGNSRTTGTGNHTTNSNAGKESLDKKSIGGGSINASNSVSSEKSLSVAEKRRRKAMAAATAASTDSGSVTKSISSSRDTEPASNINSTTSNVQLPKVQPQSQIKPDDNDPPLVLYESSGSDASEDEGEARAISKKGKKKKGGFSKMKKLMRIGNKSPSKDRSNDKSKRNTGRNSPFRKRSSSRPRGTKNDDMSQQSRSSEVTSGKIEPKIVAEAPKAEVPKALSLKKIESGLSIDEPVPKSIARLESDLSLDKFNFDREIEEEEAPGKIVEVEAPPVPENNLSMSKSSSKSHQSRSSSRSRKSKSSSSTRQKHQFEGDVFEESNTNGFREEESRSSRDPPDVNNGNMEINDESAISDEVSEMTNPTYVSNKMDPPEELKVNDSNRSVSRSVRSNYIDSDTDTPLMSNQLQVLHEDNVEESRLSSHDEEDELEDEFFGGVSWGQGQQQPPQKNFFVTTDLGESSSNSRDPFEDPFYPTVQKSKPDSDKKFSFDYSLSDEEESEPSRFEAKKNGQMSPEAVAPIDSYYPSVEENPASSVKSKPKLRTRSISPSSKIDMKKLKDRRNGTKNESPRRIGNSTRDASPRRNESPRRNTSPRRIESSGRHESPRRVESSRRIDKSPRRNESPSKAEVMKRSAESNGFLGIDETSGAVTLNVDGLSQNKRNPSPESRRLPNETDDNSSYFSSPGVKLGQDRNLVKNKDGFLRKAKQEEVQRSPEYAKTPSFIAKRKNRDKKEEDIRAKLETERQAALLNAKRRMEDVSRAAETGRRRDELINSSNERTSPERLSAFGRANISPPKSRNNSISPMRSFSPERSLEAAQSISPMRSRSISPQRRSNVKVNTVAAHSSFRGERGQIRSSDRSVGGRSHSSMRIVESTRGSGPPMRVSRSFSNENDAESVYSVPEKQIAKKKTFKAPAAFNKDSGSKRFKAPEAFKNPDMVPALSLEITDPIQRAGMRLLSAAAVPIQTEIRRYLAKRVAEERLWAVIVIQSYFRRWKAELMIYKNLYCATKIQAVFRGWLVRDTLDHKHFCATQIQRVCRGYLATMKVYEALYNITVVQSIARRNAAIKEAETRYLGIVAIQSAWRGHACRRDIEQQHQKAVVIQKMWRGFTAQLNYQFDIVDIIIVQSIARKRACQKRYEAIQHKRHTKAAVVIQKYWRSYDCTMNYLHSIADILIVQSIVRRWIASRYVPRYRKQRDNEMATQIQTAFRGYSARKTLREYKSAVMIQKTWRGFKQYIEYIFTVADVVLVQKTIRSWLAKRHFEAVKIQRGEERIQAAAVAIQKTWRRHYAHMNMLFTLVHIIIVQSVIRRRLAIVKFKPMLMENRAAVTLQCAWRSATARHIYEEESAARKIQAVARGWFAKSSYTIYIAARRIQSWYRCRATRRGYLYYISARRIQTNWRGYDARKLADEERWVREYAATMIQKNWRMHSQYSKYTRYVLEKRSATKIQSQWRCFWEYSHFVILRYELIRIQAAVRGYQTRKDLDLKRRSATVIQTAARGMLAKKFAHMERLFATVMYSAQMSLTYKNATNKLVKGFRDLHYSMKEKRAALVIERFFIWVRDEVEREIERREKLKSAKRKKQRSKRNISHNDLLDDVWEETVDSSSKAGKNPPKRIVQKRDAASVRSKTRSVTHRVRSFSPIASTVSVRKRPQRNVVHRSHAAKNTSSPLLAKKIPLDLNNKQTPAKTRNISSADPTLGALDFDDASSEVSGLTTPTITPRYPKHKKSTNTSLDEELNQAWAETKRKVLQKRVSRKGIQSVKVQNDDQRSNSSKENSVSPPKTRQNNSTNSPTRARRYKQSLDGPTSPTRSRSELRLEMIRNSKA